MVENTPPTSNNAKLYGALLVAQRAISGIANDATNKHQGYDYTSAEALIGGCRKALHDAGVVVTRRMWNTVMTTTPPFVQMEFVVSHPASGETQIDRIDWPAIEQKGRPLDKAVGGALTSAMGYYLRDLLAVPRADGDMNDRDDRGHTPSPPKTPAKPPAEDVNHEATTRIVLVTLNASSGTTSSGKPYTVHEITISDGTNIQTVDAGLSHLAQQNIGKDCVVAWSYNGRRNKLLSIKPASDSKTDRPVPAFIEMANADVASKLAFVDGAVTKVEDRTHAKDGSPILNKATGKPMILWAITIDETRYGTYREQCAVVARANEGTGQLIRAWYVEDPPRGRRIERIAPINDAAEIDPSDVPADTTEPEY
jgi:hypothetical protein